MLDQIIVPDRAPEEYPPNLGIPRMDILRRDFDVADIVRQAARSYAEHGYVHVICFWGVGWRATTQSIDRLGLAHLGLLRAYMQKVLLKGVRLTLLVGDTHAAANLIDPVVVDEYCVGIQRLATEFGLEAIRTSSLPAINALMDGMTAEEESAYAPHAKRFERSSARLSSHEYSRRARNYFSIRYREREVIVKRFPHAILANSDTPDRAVLAPRLPGFWIYALPGRRLKRHKPWFLPRPFKSQYS